MKKYIVRIVQNVSYHYDREVEAEDENEAILKPILEAYEDYQEEDPVNITVTDGYDWCREK